MDASKTRFRTVLLALTLLLPLNGCGHHQLYHPRQGSFAAQRKLALPASRLAEYSGLSAHVLWYGYPEHRRGGGAYDATQPNPQLGIASISKETAELLLAADSSNFLEQAAPTVNPAALVRLAASIPVEPAKDPDLREVHRFTLASRESHIRGNRRQGFHYDVEVPQGDGDSAYWQDGQQRTSRLDSVR